VATLPANNTAEGGSNGTGVTVGNSGGTSGTAFDVVTIDASAAAAFDNTHPAHGSLSYMLTGSGSGGAFLEWDSVQTTVFGRAYILAGSFPAGVTSIIDPRNAGAITGSIRLNAAKKLDLYDATGTLVASGVTVLVAVTQYRVEFQFVFSATVGVITAKLFAGDATTVTETITASALNTSAQMTQFRWSWRPFTTDVLWMDDLNLNTTGFPGPAVTARVVNQS
jgi:hypothetical protein